MRRVAAIVVIAFAACSSARKGDDELPSMVPPAELRPQAAAADPRVTELETSLTELLDRLDVLNARIAKLEVAAAVPPPQAVGNGAKTSATESGSPASTPLHSAQIADDYRRAIVLVSKGRPAEARTVFQQVFDADPSGDLADNALFWIGETYFGAGRYSDAMRYYERVAKEYPDQNKAPDAVYKMGITYEKTGDLGMAQRTFEACIAKYPYSSPAASARMELKKIKY